MVRGMGAEARRLTAFPQLISIRVIAVCVHITKAEHPGSPQTLSSCHDDGWSS